MLKELLVLEPKKTLIDINSTELSIIQSSVKDDLKSFESVSYLRYYE